MKTKRKKYIFYFDLAMIVSGVILFFGDILGTKWFQQHSG